MAIQPLSAFLLGSSAIAAVTHAPRILSTSLPLGAIIFWFKRKLFIELKENG
ncbi:MAG: hypothetical protein OEW99_06615 [Gammaproteobacteria bacterium]|nr:hypothetical protein [Gammaproteobacteria bacterium]